MISPLDSEEKLARFGGLCKHFRCTHRDMIWRIQSSQERYPLQFEGRPRVPLFHYLLAKWRPAITAKESAEIV
jgi:hypothetical protein